MARATEVNEEVFHVLRLRDIVDGKFELCKGLQETKRHSE